MCWQHTSFLRSIYFSVNSNNHSNTTSDRPWCLSASPRYSWRTLVSRVTVTKKEFIARPIGGCFSYFFLVHLVPWMLSILLRIGFHRDLNASSQSPSWLHLSSSLLSSALQAVSKIRGAFSCGHGRSEWMRWCNGIAIATSSISFHCDCFVLRREASTSSSSFSSALLAVSKIGGAFYCGRDRSGCLRWCSGISLGTIPTHLMMLWIGPAHSMLPLKAIDGAIGLQ